MNANKENLSIIISVGVTLMLSVSFGLIACFANTQSIVEILLAGSMSASYAARSGAMRDWFRIFESSRLERLFSTCIGWLDFLMGLIIIVLSVISIFGLIFGFIEPNLVNIFLPAWAILTFCIGILMIYYYKMSKSEEKEDYHENKEIDY